MSKLYIIGNGFDVAHGLNTKYWELRKYIEETDSEFLMNFENMYNIQPLDDTEPWYTKNAQEQWDENVEQNLWSEFESLIGNPDLQEILGYSKSITEGMPLYGIRDTMDVYWDEQYSFIKRFKKLVKNWIENIDTNNVKCKKSTLLNSGDIFFTFNYTDVLEKIYGIKNVFHIHGGVETICDTSPIMGHCKTEKIEQYKNWMKECEDEFNEVDASALNMAYKYLLETYKDTNNLIDRNLLFFEKLSNVNHVLIIGWSAGEVDLPYLIKIKNSISKSAKWSVYYYNCNARYSLKNLFEKTFKNEFENVEYIDSKLFWLDDQDC